jgi:cytochrome c peroxidase
MKFIVISWIFLGAKVAIATINPNAPKLAPGYGILEFSAPKAGSYQLSSLGKAGDGSILTTENQSKKLFDFMGDKLVLLSFIYATCNDINGCPLATMVFHQIKKRLLKEAEITSKLRLLTLSFNPLLDTPEKMLEYSQSFQDKGLEWQFLTTKSETELKPILQHYQQNIQKVYDEQGQFTGTFSHILRVYLIDQNKMIRNIYSVDFLHADTLINDIKTLLLEESKNDNQNIALQQHRGKPTDLLKNSLQPPLGLPTIIFPDDNPQTIEKIALGRKLFYDRRLSINNNFYC